MELLWWILGVVFIYLCSGIRVINQYEKGLVFTLGRFTGVREPGLK